MGCGHRSRATFLTKSRWGHHYFAKMGCGQVQNTQNRGVATIVSWKKRRKRGVDTPGHTRPPPTTLSKCASKRGTYSAMRRALQARAWRVRRANKCTAGQKHAFLNNCSFGGGRIGVRDRVLRDGLGRIGPSHWLAAVGGGLRPNILNRDPAPCYGPCGPFGAGAEADRRLARRAF